LQWDAAVRCLLKAADSNGTDDIWAATIELGKSENSLRRTMCDVSTAWLITAFVIGAICGIMITIGFVLATILRLARRSAD
jgi:uncharacterized membrane protein YoaK (UPF0700 family)